MVLLNTPMQRKKPNKQTRTKIKTKEKRELKKKLLRNN